MQTQRPFVPRNDRRGVAVSLLTCARNEGGSSMASRDKWTFGATSLQRVVENEDSMMPPFEIYGDCTQAHLDQHRHWLVPRFQNPDNGRLVITIQSFLVRQNGLTILV